MADPTQQTPRSASAVVMVTVKAFLPVWPLTADTAELTTVQLDVSLVRHLSSCIMLRLRTCALLTTVTTDLHTPRIQSSALHTLTASSTPPPCGVPCHQVALARE